MVTVPVSYPMTARSMYSVQKEHAAGYDGTDRDIKLGRRKYFAAMTAAGVTAGVVLLGGQAVLDNELTQRNGDATTQILDEAGVLAKDRSRVAVDPQAVRDRVNSWSSANRVWGDWTDKRETVHNFMQFDDGTHLGNDADSGSGIGGKVGNVNTLRMGSVWSLTPHNLPDEALTGHWSVDTASVLEATRGKDGVPTLAWNQHTVVETDKTSHGDTVDAILETHPTTSPGSLKQKSIEVHGVVGEGAATAMGAVSIPVLEGYAVSAVNINGEPVDVLHKKDGTYALSVGPNIKESDVVTYWVTQSENRRVRSADSFWLLPESGTEGDDIIDYPGLVQTLKLGATDNKRPTATEFVDYMQENFTYSYTPWPEEEVAKQQTVAGLIDMTMKEKQANCNVAATLLVLESPGDKSAVFEYENGDNVRTLSGNEAHARVVTGAGNTYDATPALPAIIKPEKPDRPAPMPVGPIALAAAAIVAGAVSFKGRRRIKSVASASATELVERTVGGSLRSAVAATEHAIWSGPDAQISPRQLAEAKTDRTMTAKQALRTLAEPERHSTDAINHVDRQKAVSGLQRLAIKIAAIRAARSAAKADKQARKAYTSRHRAT